ncbi:GNAT family N-acetyltransferase [[Clostridium] dakarense]|uniref:GNAT family N-acetyltransferase n=1 Tax=Faecalimicrobium dakarense TaxID=1301100 RepID=UPI0004B0ABF4|nr:GNAT family N-acetyltransferase [[Clostridium] dakarense]
MRIRPISQDDIPKVVETMVSSFMKDELYSYFIAENDKREKVLRLFMKFRLKFGIKNGIVKVTDDCNGVAIWISPNAKMKPTDLIFLGGITALLTCNSNERKRILSFNNYSEQIVETCVQQPYWYLSPICVSEEFQGKGYGKSLILDGLKDINLSEAPCFLETQSDKNKSIYEKFKFECVSATNVPEAYIMNYGMIYNFTHDEYNNDN